MSILIVNAVEWGPEHQGPDLPPICSMDVGEWIKRGFGSGDEGSDRLFIQWNVIKEDRPPSDDYRAVAISGSPASAYDDLPWIRRLADSIRNWAARGVPVLGICFGHQLIAQALGGRVEKNPLGWEVGTQEIELTEEGKRDPLFAGLPGKFKVMQSHQDIVTALPPGAVCLASSPLCKFQSMKIGDHIRTVQFHPEYTPEHMRFIVEPRRKRLAGLGIDVDKTLAGIQPTEESGTLFGNFERGTRSVYR